VFSWHGAAPNGRIPRGLPATWLSWLFFQAHEGVNRRVAIGAAAIFVGTVLLIIYR
jgi:hypothetical protein